MISPQEKAEELYNKFYAWYPNQDAQFIAKQCALIAVDEILLTLYEFHYDSESGAYEYWKQVKTEIEKL